MLTFLRSSQEAVTFGKNANPRQIKILKILRDFHLQAAKAFQKDSSISCLDKMSAFATQAQFMREALEAAK